MVQDSGEEGVMGASPTATGLSPSVEPASGLAGSATSIPSAEWICERAKSILEYEAANLDAIADDYRKARQTGEMHGRRIKPEQARMNAYEFASRADALWIMAPIVAKDLAQAIEARRAETGTGSVHESAVGNADAPNSDHQDTIP